MGIYDREYYRKEGPRFLDGFLPAGTVCKWLIGLNVLVFLIQLLTRQEPWFTAVLWLDPTAVLDGQVWRLLTYSFLHDPFDLLHILFNMLFLWWFGSELEGMYGQKEFLTFYLVAALVGGVGHELQYLVTGHPIPALGASGAVTAVMVLYAFHFPRRTILLFFILPVPIWALVVFQVAQDAFHLFGNRATGVAVAVHLGGAAFAAAYYNFHWRLTGFLGGWRAWRRQRSRPNLKVFRPDEDEAVAVGARPAWEIDEHLEAKVDAVLEKVARSGQESLTDQERKILMQASEIYKKRRT